MPESFEKKTSHNPNTTHLNILEWPTQHGLPPIILPSVNVFAVCGDQRAIAIQSIREDGTDPRTAYQQVGVEEHLITTCLRIDEPSYKQYPPIDTSETIDQ